MGEIQFRMRDASPYFLVPVAVTDKFLVEADETQLKVLLFLLRRSQEDLSLSDVCVYLQKGREAVEQAVSFWLKRGVLDERDGYIVFGDSSFLMPQPAQRKVEKKVPSYTPGELADRREQDRNFRELISFAEERMGKLLTMHDLSLLFSFYDWMGLPCDVIALLIQFCCMNGHKNMRYMEKVALSWADLGIDSQEKAEAEIARAERKKETEYQIRRLMGIGERALTTSERQYLKTWTEEWRFTVEMIRLAYERTVDKTGKVSFAYMNSILKTWRERKFETPEQARGEKRPEQGGTKSKDLEELERISMEILRGERK